LQRERIIFLDLMRAIGVVLMVEGHTVDALLAPVYRNPQNYFYFVWSFIRGFTAPIFMFTAGVVFTYLFFLNGKKFEENPRVKKGLKRFVTLVFIGYLLRYPSWKIIDFSIVTKEQWLTFFVVDALHLIGFGILTLVLILFVVSRFKINFNLTVLISTFFILSLTVVFNNFPWQGVPIFIANYFTSKFGSLFPLFPWLAYLILGGILGRILAVKPFFYKKKSFGLNLILFGILFISAYILLSEIHSTYLNISEIEPIRMFALRLGGALILNGITAVLVLKISSIPKLIILLGRNTLLIYVVHLIILYGSPWSKGLNFLIGEKLTFLESIFSVILMFAFVIGMVLAKERFKKNKKEKLAFLKTTI